MKKIISLVILIIVIVLGSYYGMGIATEKTLKNNLARINQSNGLHVQISEYKRNWFTADVLLNWRIFIPAHSVKSTDGQAQTLPAQNFYLKMPLTIHHGPVIFANHTVQFGLGYGYSNLDLPVQYQEQLNNLYTITPQQPQVNFSLFINYLKNSKLTMAVPAFTLKAKNGDTQINWNGINSEVFLTSSLNKIKGKVTIGAMEFSKDNVITTLSDISSQYNMHASYGGLYLGEITMHLPSLLVKNQTQTIFSLDELRLNTTSDITNQLYNSGLDISITKIVAEGKNFGPGRLALAIKNLDADVLLQIAEQAKIAQQGTQLEKQQAMLAMLPQLPKLFSKGAEFELSKFDFTMPEGVIEGSADIAVPKNDDSNPFAMMQKIHGSGKFIFPAEVIKQILFESNKQKVINQAAAMQTDPVQPIPIDVAQQASQLTNAQIAAMTGSGVILPQGNNYKFEFNFDQGHLMINGKPFDPAMLKF